jgi:hypothetical protein
MFDVQKVQSGLQTSVGIRAALDPALPTLTTSLQTSDSGLYLNDIAGFDLAAFKNTQEFATISEIKFNELLENTRKSAITDVMYQVFSAPSYIDRNYIYSRPSSRTNLETGIPEGFAGFRIVIDDRKNVGFKISRVRLEYDTSDGPVPVTLFLFNSFVRGYMEIQQITLNEPDEVLTLNWTVNASSVDNDYKGEYYFVISIDSTIVPFKRDYKDAIVQNDLAGLCIEPMSVFDPGGNVNGFDPNAIQLISGTNTGMNPDISVFYDYTDVILRNPMTFYRAIQLQWAIKLMNICATSMRSNRDERKAKEIVAMIMTYVNGQRGEGLPYIKGHDAVLLYEVEQIKKQIESIKNGYGTDTGYEGIEVVTQT